MIISVEPHVLGLDARKTWEGQPALHTARGWSHVVGVVKSKQVFSPRAQILSLYHQRLRQLVLQAHHPLKVQAIRKVPLREWKDCQRSWVGHGDFRIATAFRVIAGWDFRTIRQADDGPRWIAGPDGAKCVGSKIVGRCQRRSLGCVIEESTARAQDSFRVNLVSQTQPRRKVVSVTVIGNFVGNKPDFNVRTDVPVEIFNQAAIGDLVGNQHGASRLVPAKSVVTRGLQRRFIFVPQSKVDRQLGRHFPVVVKVGSRSTSAVSPKAWLAPSCSTSMAEPAGSPQSYHRYICC